MPKIKRICQQCGEVFYVWPSVIKKGEGKYHNIKCKGKSKVGRKLTEEHKKKISNVLTGRKLTEEHKKNLRKYNKTPKGKNNHRWKGGRKERIKRITIKARDGRKTLIGNYGQHYLKKQIAENMNQLIGEKVFTYSDVSQKMVDLKRVHLQLIRGVRNAKNNQKC